MSLLLTAAQTVGPFVAISFEHTLVQDVARPGVSGERIVIQGRVLDGDGKPVEDAVLETWQANGHGKYSHPEDTREKLLEPAFKGFGRVLSNRDGAFRFSTIKPGRVPGPNDVMQAPHLVVLVFMRGLLKHLVTRVYFPEEAANREDPVLGLVPAERRSTLVATRAGDGVLEWNVVLQGPNETVFFDY
ncbi:MAG: protocatechuate 3,4-dioxygenase subunit alpha [Burkholderiales bacterium]